MSDFDSTNPSVVGSRVIDCIRKSGYDVDFVEIKELERGECIDDAQEGYFLKLRAGSEELVRSLAVDAFGENEYDSGEYGDYCWVVGANSISVYTF